MPAWKDRRRAQAGTTLIELLVSLMIVGLALVLIVGTFSTGLLDATVAKRNTAVQAVMQYELDRITASPFSPTASSYSECFATESSIAPFFLPTYQDLCPSGQPFSLRADVTCSRAATPCTQPPISSSPQLWTITVTACPAVSPWTCTTNAAPIGSPVRTYKVNR